MKWRHANPSEANPCVVPSCIVLITHHCMADNTAKEATNINNDKLSLNDEVDQSLMATIGTATMTEETDTDGEEFTTTIDESTTAELMARQ